LTGKREHNYHDILLDPEQIFRLVDSRIEAHRE
jgi:hypothetical protein